MKTIMIRVGSILRRQLNIGVCAIKPHHFAVARKRRRILPEHTFGCFFPIVGNGGAFVQDFFADWVLGSKTVIQIALLRWL